jgi:hypothetical protein
MRTSVEIKLLTMRQALKERLDKIKQSNVVEIEEYRQAFLEFESCQRLLFYYRKCKVLKVGA